MSRTEGVTLPRLPTSHARVTSPTSIQPQSGRQETEHHRRAFSEPNYTAYIGTPRQDVPPHVYRDAAMFDDVFDKKGKLLTCRNTPKISSPLHTLEYNSLHDPHCRKLFLNNKKLRSHLTNLGLITNDLRVVANTQEQRQKIRSHELLERKEQLIQRLEDREHQRIERFQRQVSMPKQYRQCLEKNEERRVRAQRVRQLKVDKVVQAEKEKQRAVERKREDYRQKLQEAVEEARLMEQSKRNTARAKQEMTEIVAYERQYGKFGQHLANWHRDSDRIHNRMVIMEHKRWSKARNQTWLSETYPPQALHSPELSVVDVERVPQLPPILVPRSGADTPQREAADTTGLDPQHQSKSTEQQPIPVPPGDTEQKETQDVEQTPAEQRETLEEKEKEARPLSELKQPDVMPQPKEVTVSEEGKGHVLKTKDEGEGVLVKGGRSKEVEVEGAAAPPLQQVVVLNPEQSTQELIGILIDALQKLDYRRTGFLHTDDFVQVLNSRDLGLQLDENELLYVANQVDVYGNGWVPFIHVAPLLPNLLLTIYTQRAEQAIQQYGGYTEEQWCQLYPNSGGICYFNKLTGVLQYGRPDDFRPFLKDDVFEDSIVDFFETADANKDGILEYDDFYTLLVSPMVSTRIYSNQMEQLLQLYQAYAVGGRMGLEEFAPVARALLLMIYQNAYPDVEEWIQLDSRKVGTFWFNKISGETFVPPESTAAAEAEVEYQLYTGQPIQKSLESRQGWEKTVEEREEEKQLPKSRKRKKHSKAKRTTPEDAAAQRPPSQGPPPLRRRSSKSHESTHAEDSSKEQLPQSAEDSSKEQLPQSAEDSSKEQLPQSAEDSSKEQLPQSAEDSSKEQLPQSAEDSSKEQLPQSVEPSKKRNEVEVERSENMVETITTIPKTEDEVAKFVGHGVQRFETIPEEKEEEEEEEEEEYNLDNSQQNETQTREHGLGSGRDEVAVITSVSVQRNGGERPKDACNLDEKQSNSEHHTIQDNLSASHSNHKHAQQHQGGNE